MILRSPAIRWVRPRRELEAWVPVAAGEAGDVDVIAILLAWRVRRRTTLVS
jgi:hypothetical protein